MLGLAVAGDADVAGRAPSTGVGCGDGAPARGAFTITGTEAEAQSPGTCAPRPGKAPADGPVVPASPEMLGRLVTVRTGPASRCAVCGWFDCATCIDSTVELGVNAEPAEAESAVDPVGGATVSIERSGAVAAGPPVVAIVGVCVGIAAGADGGATASVTAGAEVATDVAGAASAVTTVGDTGWEASTTDGRLEATG